MRLICHSTRSLRYRRPAVYLNEMNRSGRVKGSCGPCTYHFLTAPCMDIRLMGIWESTEKQIRGVVGVQIRMFLRLGLVHFDEPADRDEVTDVIVI